MKQTLTELTLTESLPLAAEVELWDGFVLPWAVCSCGENRLVSCCSCLIVLQNTPSISHSSEPV